MTRPKPSGKHVRNIWTPRWEALNNVADSIDTTVLVAAIVAAEDFHSVCRPLAVGGQTSMYSHGIAKTFSTLTSGRQNFRLSANTVSALLGDHFVPQLEITVLTPKEVLHAMRECESRGVRGGAIVDYLHLVAARKARADRLYTLNISNFRSFHRAGDPEVVHP